MTLIHPVERFVDVKPVAVTSLWCAMLYVRGRSIKSGAPPLRNIGAGGGPQIPLHPSTTTKKKLRPANKAKTFCLIFTVYFAVRS